MVLPEPGFSIEEMQTDGNYFESLAQELRRLPELLEKWTQEKWSVRERIARGMLLNLLAEILRQDRGSWQLLHFSRHIRAIRRGS
jgi:hypothetical protein